MSYKNINNRDNDSKRLNLNLVPRKQSIHIKFNSADIKSTNKMNSLLPLTNTEAYPDPKILDEYLLTTCRLNSIHQIQPASSLSYFASVASLLQLDDPEHLQPRRKRILKQYKQLMNDPQLKPLTNHQKKQKVDNFLTRVEIYEKQKRNRSRILQRLYEIYDFNSGQLLYYPKISEAKERDEMRLCQQEDDMDISTECSIPYTN